MGARRRTPSPKRATKGRTPSPRAEWEQRANESVQLGGRRTGGARRAVVSVLAAEDCCLSAQEISDELRGRGDRVGIASVYRALDLLRDLGLVQRVDTGDGTSRYEAVVPGGEHHHHAVCESCGAVTTFEDRRLEQAIERIAVGLRHDLSAHEVVIRGACSRCASRTRRRR